MPLKDVEARKLYNKEYYSKTEDQRTEYNNRPENKERKKLYNKAYKQKKLSQAIALFEVENGIKSFSPTKI